MRVRSRYGSGTTGPIDPDRPATAAAAAKFPSVKPSQTPLRKMCFVRRERRQFRGSRAHARTARSKLAPISVGADPRSACEAPQLLWLTMSEVQPPALYLAVDGSDRPQASPPIHPVDKAITRAQKGESCPLAICWQSTGTNFKSGVPRWDYSCSIKRQDKHPKCQPASNANLRARCQQTPR